MPFCAVPEPGEDMRTRSKCHSRGQPLSLNRPIAFDGRYHSFCLGARNVRLESICHFDRAGEPLPVSPRQADSFRAGWHVPNGPTRKNSGEQISS
jgi:hypothetical protein